MESLKPLVESPIYDKLANTPYVISWQAKASLYHWVGLKEGETLETVQEKICRAVAKIFSNRTTKMQICGAIAKVEHKVLIFDGEMRPELNALHAIVRMSTSEKIAEEMLRHLGTK